MKKGQQPPIWIDRILEWRLPPEQYEEVQGDMHELFQQWIKEKGERKARWRYVLNALTFFRPLPKKKSSFQQSNHQPLFLYPDMIRNYLIIAFRNIIKNKTNSFINIIGLSVGLTVTMLIGLWVWDELYFNTYHKNYNDIAQVWGGGTDVQSSTIEGSFALQYPVGTILKNNFTQHFKDISMFYEEGEFTVSSGDKKLNRKGQFIEGSALEMLSLKMLKGNYQSLDAPYSVILSQSTATAIFGKEDPINKRLSIDNRLEATVTGVYEDIPRNNRFSESQLFLSWPLLLSYREWMKEKANDWDNRVVNVYVQLQPTTTLEEANAAINDLYYQHVPEDFFKTIEKHQPFVQLIPMSSWHLYSEFENGKPAGGRITYVWLFGLVGFFVLLLAGINFINLSTARSSSRAREVGLRKAIGANKEKLIIQFLSESYMVVLLAFAISFLLLLLVLKPFNELADKDISIPYDNPVFWALIILFVVFTGCIAGLYPAVYLSSFQPVKVLKGVVKSGPIAALPRKMLVVVQFTVSVVLIIGTLVVYKQIQYAQNRPIGYDRQSLIALNMNDLSFEGKMDVLHTELLNSGVVSQVATSSSPLTDKGNVTGGYEWHGKNPDLDAEFVRQHVTSDFGKTVGWEVVAGRDFSGALASDSTEAIIINQAAIKYMGLRDPIGQKLIDVDDFGNQKWSKTIIGVVKDIVMESPYEPVMQTIYYFDEDASNLLHIKINPSVSASVALPRIEAVFKEVVPSALFDYKFVDEEYARKFSQEERIGTLAGLFSNLAIFISCLGLFGLASFVAEQRTKEIGIRNVLGASIFKLWKMQIKDFVTLVLLACFIAIPVSYLLMSSWLEKYDYHTNISLWILLIPCMGALSITLFTVSYQAVKAALIDPVKSLRSE